MKTTKAQEILPEELLLALQEYVQGKSIYIPKRETKNRWGICSGSRSYYDKRNQQIRNLFHTGTTIEVLATTFSLSVETIKKIVYKKI
ncbi:CD3324 family protein [Gracilibacillus sp. S3-1-1]|uniref:CD3324 family protein n=1 Tax=Gracilibacillus pellucidus TaxID=3095368 RepID=A0ACC6M6Z1_9BACI|nr:CD3324 family protein [Gracilibacillus sp. S3-1-1]MDX8046746.1 CD3324 family protein [Gracilibacillus sp. S3-1-1]